MKVVDNNVSSNIRLSTNNYASDLTEWVKFNEEPQAGMLCLQANMQKCHHYLGNPQVQELIHSKDTHFDLLILEYQDNECFLGFALRFNTPIVGVYALDGPQRVTDIMGNPSPFSYIPAPGLSHSDRLNFLERLGNTITQLQTRLDLVFLRGIGRLLMGKYFQLSHPVPTVQQVEARTAILLLNSDPSFGFARPHLQNTQYVPGMHVRPAAPLPEDLKNILDGAKAGVILFSKSTFLSELSFSPDKLRTFKKAFSMIPQIVFWRSSKETPNLPDNVKYFRWLPQADVLAHPNLLALINNGGLMSTQEAIFHGKPLIQVPLFGDQFTNANRAQHLGFGICLDYQNITVESITWAINTVIHTHRYRENARKISSRFRDHLLPPVEKAVYWTELVLRNRGAPHLRSAALDLTWYQYWLIDIAAVIVLLAITVVLVLYVTTRTLCFFMKQR